MQTTAIYAAIGVIFLGATFSANAEVRHRQINDVSFVTYVSGEAWQPEGFQEPPLLHAVPAMQVPVVDGKSDDPVWATAESLTLPLTYGTIKEAEMKAVYTDKEIFLLVSWPDATRDDQYHPWVWNAEQGRYVEGPQEEDGLLVSIEAGCDWNPNPLSGYVYDFDGWRWLAARTDPLGQAVDTSGHVQDRWREGLGYTTYLGRDQKPSWNLKFDNHGPGILTKPWQELDRNYLFLPIQGKEVFVSMEPDGQPVTAFVKQVPPPSTETGLKKVALKQPSVVPQFQPVKLTGDAGEVSAKGYWQDGRWTVEYRRVLVTPARTKTDSVIDRTTQFSLHIFDHTERIDEASESGRIFLQFEPAKEWPEVVDSKIYTPAY